MGLFFVPVLADDSAGNKFLFVDTLYGQHLEDHTSYIEYVEDYNITYDTYISRTFSFNLMTYFNASNATTGDMLVDYLGVGIQIYYDNDTAFYENAVEMYALYVYAPNGVQQVLFETGNLIFPEVYREHYYVNATMWVNYDGDGDVANYTLVDTWKFNLYAENYGETDTTTDTTFYDYFLLGTILGGFGCPLCFVGAIKLHSLHWIGYSIIFLMIFLSCLFVILGVNYVDWL